MCGNSAYRLQWKGATCPESLVWDCAANAAASSALSDVVLIFYVGRRVEKATGRPSNEATRRERPLPGGGDKRESLSSPTLLLYDGARGVQLVHRVERWAVCIRSARYLYDSRVRQEGKASDLWEMTVQTAQASLQRCEYGCGVHGPMVDE